MALNNTDQEATASGSGILKSLTSSQKSRLQNFLNRAAQSVWCLMLEQKANLFGNENRIPRAENIAPNKAVQIAKDRLAAIGCDMSSYEVSIWYKAAASSAVENARHDFHYVIYFVDDLDSPAKAFSVTIHAATGEEGRIYRPERLVRTDSPYMIVGCI